MNGNGIGTDRIEHDRVLDSVAQNIEQRLGSLSSAYKLDRATLATLYDRNRDNPTVQVKRKLWTQLLLSALGTQFTDDDDAGFVAAMQNGADLAHKDLLAALELGAELGVALPLAAMTEARTDYVFGVGGNEEDR